MAAVLLLYHTGEQWCQLIIDHKVCNQSVKAAAVCSGRQVWAVSHGRLCNFIFNFQCFSYVRKPVFIGKRNQKKESKMDVLPHVTAVNE